MKCPRCGNDLMHTGNEVVMQDRKQGETYAEARERSQRGVHVESYTCPVCGDQGFTTYK